MGLAIWAAAATEDGRKLKAGEAGLLAVVSTHPQTSLGLEPFYYYYSTTVVATTVTTSMVNPAAASIHRQQPSTYHVPVTV